MPKAKQKKLKTEHKKAVTAVKKRRKKRVLKNPEKDELVIDRATWARTLEDGSGHLLDPSEDARLQTRAGGKCCLGFYCEQFHGASKRKMLGIGVPNEIGITALGDFYITELTRANDRDNDLVKLSNSQQEALIVGLFFQAGIRTKFVGSKNDAVATA